MIILWITATINHYYKEKLTLKQ